jgi:type I restriction-modification system DNA methylase subunit
LFHTIKTLEELAKDNHKVAVQIVNKFITNEAKANVIFFNNKPANKNAWIKKIWFYDYKTKIHHTLEKNL